MGNRTRDFQKQQLPDTLGHYTIEVAYSEAQRIIWVQYKVEVEIFAKSHSAFVTQPPARCHNPPSTATTTPPWRRHRQTTPTAAAATTTTTVTGTLARRCHHCHDDADSAATAFAPGDLPVRPPLRAPSGFVHLWSCPPTPLCQKKQVKLVPHPTSSH